MTLIILLLFYPSSLSYVRLKIEDEDGPNVCTDASAYNWGIITTIQVFPFSIDCSSRESIIHFCLSWVARLLLDTFGLSAITKLLAMLHGIFRYNRRCLVLKDLFFFILPRKFLLQRMSALSYGIKRTVGYRIPVGWLLCLIPDDICWLIARSWA